MTTVRRPLLAFAPRPPSRFSKYAAVLIIMGQSMKVFDHPVVFRFLLLVALGLYDQVFSFGRGQTARYGCQFFFVIMLSGVRLSYFILN